MKLLKHIKNDLKKILPPMSFFLIAFTLIQVSKRLILSEYGISWTGLGSAVIGAFMIGKVVLLVDKLPFANRFPDRELICKATWKCLIYYVAAFFLQYLERAVPLVMQHASFLESNRRLMAETVWPHFWLIQMWLVVLFFIYCAMRELILAIGREKVVRMFFGRGNNGIG